MDPIFFHLFAKTWTAGPTNMKFGIRINQRMLYKKLENNFFCGGSRSWGKYLPNIFKTKIIKEIFEADFEGQVQLVPTFYSHPAKSLVELELILL